MKNIVLLNWSPQMKGSTSLVLLDMLETFFEANDKIIHIDAGKSILTKNQKNDYASIKNADILVIAFPLYIYCLPASLQEFLVEYKDYLQEETSATNQTIYAIINCGFPEASINTDAALVIKNFSEAIHAEYRFSILIGGGGMLQPMHAFPAVKRSWNSIKEGMEEIVSDSKKKEEKSDKIIDLKMRKKIFYFFAETNFKYAAKKNGVSKKGIYAQPYKKGQ